MSDSTPSATLVLQSDVVTAGSPIIALYTAVNPSAGDGISCAPAPGNSYNVSQHCVTYGLTEGSANFAQPWAAGQYIVTYVSQSGVTLAQVTATVVDAVTVPTQASLVAAPGQVQAHVPITVSFTATAPGANDWIGLYRVGARDSAPLASQPTGGRAQGSLTFAAPAQEGAYEFRYYVYGDTTPRARSAPVTVLTAQVSLSATPGSVPSGASITVTWDAVGGTAADTIGLFAVGGGDAAPLATQPTGAAGTGTLLFTAPDQLTPVTTPGNFEFRYFFAGSGVAAATSNTLTVTLPRVSLGATPGAVEPGGSLRVSWEATNTTSSDAIGLYALDAVDGSPLSYRATRGDATGTLSFAAPTTAGAYVFRYLLGGATALAHSDMVSVYGVAEPPTTVADSLPDAVPRSALEEIIVNRAINDGAWRDLLTSDPTTALTQLFGRPPPAGVSLHVLVEAGVGVEVDNAGLLYFVVPGSAQMAMPDESDWVVAPVLPPGQLESSGVIDGSEPPAAGSGSPPDAGTKVEDLESEARGPEEIASGLGTLDASVSSVAVVGVAPMALTSREDFRTQVDYLLYTDPAFYNSFIANAQQAVEQRFNYRFPPGVTLTPLVETSNSAYIVLPYPPFTAIFTPPYAAAFASTSSVIEVPGSESLSTPGAITIEVWFKAAAFHGATDDVLVSTHTSSGGWELRVGGGVPRFVVNINGADHVAQSSDPRLILDTDTWYYLAGVYDGQQVRLYLNELVLSPPAAASGSIGPNADTMTLGCSPGQPGGQERFQGLLYDVRLWSEALGPDRLRSDLLVGRGQTPAPGEALRAWYPMVEGAGTTLYDHSGNGNNGTLRWVAWSSTYPDTP